MKPKHKSLRKKAQERERYKENAQSGDPHAAELNMKLHTAPRVANKVFLRGKVEKLSLTEKIAIRRERREVTRDNLLIKKLRKENEKLREDTDMAGPFALERALLFVESLRSQKISHREFLLFLLLTNAAMPMSLARSADLIGASLQSVQAIVGRLESKGFIALAFKGKRGRSKGLFSSSKYEKTDNKGKKLWQIAKKFRTNDYGSIAALIKGNEIQISPDKCNNDRKALFESTVQSAKEILLDF